MKIAIASDHRGVECKKEVINYLKERGYEVIDCSPNNTPTDDYPDYAFKVCEMVANNEADDGVLVCRTGIGMSIAANKINGIRAALCSDSFSTGERLITARFLCSAASLCPVSCFLPCWCTPP